VGRRETDETGGLLSKIGNLRQKWFVLMAKSRCPSWMLKAFSLYAGAKEDKAAEKEN
jgi:hypothetical protein